MRLFQKKFYMYFASLLVFTMFGISQDTMESFREDYEDENEIRPVELHFGQKDLADLKIFVSDPTIDCKLTWFPAQSYARFSCKSFRHITSSADEELAETCYRSIVSYRFLNEFNLEYIKIIRQPTIRYRVLNGIPTFIYEREFFVQRR